MTFQNLLKMFKVNYYSILFLVVLFLHNLNVLGSSFNQTEISIFPTISESTDIGTPQLYNWHFNSSTNTFIPPLVLPSWDPNGSTGTFNTFFSNPYNTANFDNISVDANNNEIQTQYPVLSNTESRSIIPSNTSSPSAVSHRSETKDQMSFENDEEKNNKKGKKNPTKKTYTCPTCHKTLGSQRAFDYHIKTHDPNRPRPFECHICYKNFVAKNTLKTHLKRHNKEKAYKCNYCNKRFVTKYEKMEHHRTHTGEKPYQCDICQKCFSMKASLKRHLPIHKSKKQFKCEFCHKNLSSKDTLKVHLKIHTQNEKKYKCSICNQDKYYMTKNGLDYHIGTHNRPKPYTCSYCNDSFTFKSEYKNHMRYHEETDEDVKCHICKKIYSTKYNLREHNERAHSSIPDS